MLQGHLAELLPGRQDRRARPQRRRQVDAAADHGRASTRSTAARRSSRPARPSGCSSRSRSSTSPRTCAATSRTACAELRDLLDRFNELAANYSDETADEFARLQEQIDAADAWNLDTHARHRRWTRCACPPGDADVTTLSGGERRRVALCRLLLLRARPAAARRADQPPRRRVGRLARAATSRTTRARSSPSPTIATSSTTSPAGSSSSTAATGIPFKGNYSALARAEAGAPRAGGAARSRARQRTIAAELEWVRENPKGRRKKSKARLNRYEALLAEERNVEARPGPDPHPGRAAPRRQGDRGRRACARASATGC